MHSHETPRIPPQSTPEQFEQIAKAIDPSALVVSTRKLAGGISCRMDVLEYAKPGAPSNKVVTRQYWLNEDQSGPAKPRFESIVLKTLNNHRLPATELILDEQAAATIFSRPGIVISYIDGTPDLAPKNPNAWARQLARGIAQVHSIDVPDELMMLSKSHTDSVTEWMAEDSPPEKFVGHKLGSDLWRAMRELWPDIDTPESQLIHTDFWPGNTLSKDGQLVAITDWEWPALGDPMSDVAYFLSDAAYVGLDVESAFIDEYEKSSGRPVHDLKFWKMMAAAIPMPDPGPWAIGYAELGVRKMTADEIRRSHSTFIRGLLS